MYLNKLESLLSIIYPKLTWKRNTSEKVVYLTFDDGPIPEVTAFVLTLLEHFNAKATFFCVGDNIRKNPEVFANIIKKGHKVGNHTYNHLNGWKTDDTEYFKNINDADAVLLEYLKDHSSTAHLSNLNGKKLFRPPYGKISSHQQKKLINHYEIVMWGALTGDFDQRNSPEKCLAIAKKNTRNGTIVIFHDSVKSLHNLTYALPRFLAHFTEKGFRFETL